ncbi:hypothetical protein QG37_05823 [Candidozyma auris]|uniref:Uncharacterized protein n=1 Tax=Candidozyma auris TaxID=498019 RepID=A0A0L0NUV1_CANAR|nr:hypothetical protein QG37_05823 [[Candida] auris]
MNEKENKKPKTYDSETAPKILTNSGKACKSIAI